MRISPRVCISVLSLYTVTIHINYIDIIIDIDTAIYKYNLLTIIIINLFIFAIKISLFII